LKFKTVSDPRNTYKTDLEIDVDGNKIHTVQIVDGNFSRFNEEEAIIVPDEVKEQAVETDQ